MSERSAELAARREMLVARSNLHRLQLQHHASALRQSLVRPATFLSLASSSPVRPLLFSALTLIAGKGRFARILSFAMTAFAVLKAVRR
jgi:hypothetical protein